MAPEYRLCDNDGDGDEPRLEREETARTQQQQLSTLRTPDESPAAAKQASKSVGMLAWCGQQSRAALTHVIAHTSMSAFCRVRSEVPEFVFAAR
jgi:hypothetical protein